MIAQAVAAAVAAVLPGSANSREPFSSGELQGPSSGAAGETEFLSSLSPEKKKVVDMFPHVPKVHIIAILRNTFKPENLPKLERTTTSNYEAEQGLAMDNGTIVSRATLGRVSAFGNTPSRWSKCFLTYTVILCSFFRQDPKLLVVMMSFHEAVIRLSDTYEWQTGVLTAALAFHNYRIENNILDTDAWVMSVDFSTYYIAGKVKKRTSIAAAPRSNKGSHQANRGQSPNETADICRNYNKGKCTWPDCRRRHVCNMEGCEKEHKAINHKDEK